MSETAKSNVDAMLRQCPRRAKRIAGLSLQGKGSWIKLEDLHREPFRLFFPLATLAALIGIGLWPLLLLGWTSAYPGPSHARLMVQGFFGGFIFGFMGTAMPRLVGARPLAAAEAGVLLALFLGNVTANVVGWNSWADGLFILELVFLFSLLRRRCHTGGDLPPPSFVLVGLSFASAVVGTALHLAGRRWELSAALELLARLLSYHGFVLLAVVGAGSFLLPRFLGIGTRRSYPEGLEETPAWRRSVRLAKAAGLGLVLTFVLESVGWPRTASVVRVLIILGYLAYEMPLERLRWNWRGAQWLLLVGLLCIPVGILAAGWFHTMRATLLHIELVGGFALITFGVATRVVFGHSGGRDRLGRFHLGLTGAALLMLLGLLARVSGDFLPGIQATHYLYGAFIWMTGTILWAGCVLPRVLRPDPEK